VIQQAVILAAGNGSRIERFKADVPKPLRKVAGLSLIKRAILTARCAGVREIVVVVGYKGEQIVQALENDPSLGVSLRFVFNPDYEKSNGVSLLAAQPFASGNFLLLMADHVFDPKAIRKIVNAPLGSEEVLLGIDKKLGRIFDLDDVTKVQLDGEHLNCISKDLATYNAFDTGVFVCSPAIFGVLQRAYDESGDVSLSQGVSILAQGRQVRVCDMSDYFWQDVDTPEALRHAEKILFNSVKKNTDGFVSRHFNRRISIALTRVFLKVGLSANQVTFLVTVVGLLSGYFIASGRYVEVAIGGLLFQLASILDGCDGEIAKLKLSSSRFGEWLDTISDNLTYLVFLVGVSMGAHRQLHGRFEVIEAALMFVGVGILFSLLIWYLLYYANSATLTGLQTDLYEEDQQKGSQSVFSWTSKILFLMKRDFFAFFFMLLCLADQLPLILHLSFVGVNLSWIVLLSYKKDLFRPGLSKVKVARSR
jgi:CDP-L-myo-inositol myo-inositolphosphotransferase